MKKLVYYIGILVCAGIFLSSCIREDLSGCPADGIVPSFILVPYEGNNIFNDSLYSGKVCVFDEQDMFVATYHFEGKPQLNKIYTPDWGLPPGKYNYIAWLNHLDYFQVDPCSLGKNTRTETLLQLILSESKVIDNTDNIPLLCHGSIDNCALDSATSLITIPVKQLTNRINLRITGLNSTSLRSSTATGDEYAFSITDNNAIYGFHGDFASNDYITYLTKKIYDPSLDTLKAALTVMKLSGKRQNATFSIKNNTTGEQLSLPENVSNNLVQKILSDNPQNDFDKTHSYNIAIDFSSDKDVSITVTINDWELNQSDPVLNINK